MQFKHDELAKALKAIKEVAFVYIFGSSMNGMVREGSDIDIAVYLTDEAGTNCDRLELRTNILRALEEAVPSFDNFDLVVLNTSSSILSMQALQGVLLFVKPAYENLYAGFYSYTCRKYEYDSFWMKKQLEYRGYEVQWDS
jgi:predicted nucleotidyltransferase